MKGSAQHLKLIVRNTPPVPRPAATMERRAYNLPEALYAAIADLANVDRREAKRVTVRIARELERARTGQRRRSRIPRQMDLFVPLSTVEMEIVRSVELTADVITLPAPFLLDDPAGRCPTCGHPLSERSRVGTHVYYACRTRNCRNSKALFLSLLITGDD